MRVMSMRWPVALGRRLCRAVCGPMISARMSIGCHRLHFTRSGLQKTFHKTSCRCGRITQNKPWHFGVAVGIVSAAAHGAEVGVILRSAGPGQVELKRATGTSPVSGTQAPSRSVPAAGTCQTHLLCRCICRRVTADLSHPPFANKQRGDQRTVRPSRSGCPRP